MKYIIDMNKFATSKEFSEFIRQKIKHLNVNNHITANFYSKGELVCDIFFERNNTFSNDEDMWNTIFIHLLQIKKKDFIILEIIENNEHPYSLSD